MAEKCEFYATRGISKTHPIEIILEFIHFVRDFISMCVL